MVVDRAGAISFLLPANMAGQLSETLQKLANSALDPAVQTDRWSSLQFYCPGRLADALRGRSDPQQRENRYKTTWRFYSAGYSGFVLVWRMPTVGNMRP
jgi:hypothetical protein